MNQLDRRIGSLWRCLRGTTSASTLTARPDELAEVQRVLAALGEPDRLGTLVERPRSVPCDEALAERLALGLRLMVRLAP